MTIEDEAGSRWTYCHGDALNVALGDTLLEGAKNSYVDARAGRKVAVVGLEDVVVVDTPDAILVMKRGQSQDVKTVVARLEKNEEKDLL